MEITLIIVAFVLMLIGLIGAIVPGIPGTPISLAGLIVLALTETVEFSVPFWVIISVIAVVITVLDYIVPALGTKKFGGTKKGMWGSTLGLLAGMFIISFGPLGLGGIIVGPFIGAYIGELIAHNPHPWKAAFGSFIGFLAGTLLKIVFGIAVIVIAIIALLK